MSGAGWRACRRRASLLGFLPVGEESFEADVGHGVFPEFFEDGVRHGADVGAGEGGFEDVVAVAA